MIPVLYRADGSCVGPLADCTRCYITQEMNGVYEAQIDFPLDSGLSAEITNGAYILAKPDDISPPQRFNIYKPVRPLYGIATYNCEHLRYALGGVPVSRGHYSGNPAVILSDMAQSVNGSSDFTFWSDISDIKTVDVNVPATVGKMLAGQEGSILDLFGGEYEFDNYTVKLHSSRGRARTTEIRYAKNLTGFTCETNTSSTYTHVYPFYYNEMDSVYVELPAKTIELSGASHLPFRKCYMLDLSDKFDSAPTAAQLETAARQFISRNKLDEIHYSYRVSFVPLWQTEEYKNVAALERCGLCDTVTVVHEKAGTRIRARIVRTVYDCLAERYVEMELGNAVNTFAQTVTQAINRVSDSVKSTRSFMQIAVSRATAAITGSRGGYVVLYDSNGDGEPDEILIMDTPSILTATKVWRWNAGGLGYSNHGYAGPYTTAITMQGEIVADFVSTGCLNANVIRSGVLLADLIKAGVISDTTGNISINMTNGELIMKVDNGQSIKLNRSGLKLLDTNSNVVAAMGFYRDFDNTLKGSVIADMLRADRIYIKSLGLLDSNGDPATGGFSVVSGKTNVTADTALIGMIYQVKTPSVLLKGENDNTAGSFTVNANGKSRLSSDKVSADETVTNTLDTGTLTVGGHTYGRVSVTIDGVQRYLLCESANT